MITIKQLQGAVLSVRGARSAGIQTQAAAAAPALLAEAEVVLERLLQAAERAEPSAPSMTAERRYFAAVAKATAFANAVEELRKELA